jgi:hypothetical protein
MLAIALAEGMFAYDFGTGTFSFSQFFIHKFTKLTAEQIHAEYATIVYRNISSIYGDIWIIHVFDCKC